MRMKTFYETPDDIRHQIWKELGRACQDRHHAWRTPVLATVGSDGVANARSVVLRQADAAQQMLRAFTDRRSPKVGELANNPSAVFVFWSARLSWQLRVRVTLSVQTAGPEVDGLWQRIAQSSSAGDYLAPATPGTPRQNDQDNSATTSLSHHFALLSARVSEIDWLELGRRGHRRARLRGDTWQWLTP